MIIKIDSRDLPYTVDTYQTFNGDSFQEYEGSYLHESYPELAKKYPSLEVGFDYDNPGILKALAEHSVYLLACEAVGEKWFRKDPEVATTGSPKFYNYTTDHYVAEWDIDIAELEKVTPKDWRDQAKEAGWADDDLEDEENQVVAKLHARMQELISKDDYLYRMFEKVDEIYLEHASPDEETQKAIDEIEAEREKK